MFGVQQWTAEHGTPVSRYEQLMAAGGPQMLATSNVFVSKRLDEASWF